MIEEIKKDKPQGATHWQAGTYYKKVGDKWFYWDREWFVANDVNILCMSPLRD